MLWVSTMLTLFEPIKIQLTKAIYMTLEVFTSGTFKNMLYSQFLIKIAKYQQRRNMLAMRAFASISAITHNNPSQSVLTSL